MKLVISLSLLLSLNLASAQDEVISINSGVCWYSQRGGIVKIVDFNQRRQFWFSIHVLIQDLKDQIKTKAEAYSKIKISGQFEVDFYCSDAGHILSINLFESQPQLLFQADLDAISQGKFVLNLAGRRGFTTGQKLGELIYGLQTDVTHKKFEELLKKHFPEAIESTEATPYDFGLIKLKDSSKFEVQTYINKILAHPKFKTLIKYLEPNEEAVYPGENVELAQDRF